jgi:tetratricopeptide (TPR) repeat protein
MDNAVMMESTTSRMVLVFAVCILGVFLVPQPAYALNFKPTDSEWLAWPDYCRARYVVSGAGTGSEFTSRISSATVVQQEANVGVEAWYWLHHYCAALVYLSRAAAEDGDKNARQHWLREAESNFIGQYHRVGKNNPMYSEMIISIAQLHRERDDPKTALRYLNEAIAAQPTVSSPYALASMILKDEGNLQQAISILLKGDAALNGRSAELHYFLGHIYIDVNDLDSATDHAKLAYDLGYPLPGLATKLRRLGRML